MQLNERNLRSLTTTQLRELLHTETTKDKPDDDLVLDILHLLEAREPVDIQHLTPKENAAWQKFRQRVASRKRKFPFCSNILVKVASLALVMSLLFVAIPQQAEADSLWNRLAQWSDDFFSYFHPRLEETPEEVYEFKTDNPGLQQVYDAVVEMGVTEPVVPMWLPGDYELVECKRIDTDEMNHISALFFHDNYVTLLITKQINSTSINYYKDSTTVVIYEHKGVPFNILKNYDKWVIAWAINNIECSISIGCQEDDLYEIIKSIYHWRINNETLY